METISSADGTPIAYERTGRGPPLVLVHGMAGDHTRWDIADVRAALAEHCTVYAMDRRGRGGSGDADVYELEREFEDVAALVDSIEDPVTLLGHSFGGLCALEAALLTDNLAGLIVYEPPTPWEIIGPEIYVEEVYDEMAALVERGENERLLVLFLEEHLELPPAQVDALRSSPSWQQRVAAAPTMPREYRGPSAYAFDPARFAEMTTPTLLLTGGESPPWAAEVTEALDDAIPNTRIVVFEGQEHVAMNTAPDRFVDEVLAFVREVNARSPDRRATV